MTAPEKLRKKKMKRILASVQEIINTQTRGTSYLVIPYKKQSFSSIILLASFSSSSYYHPPDPSADQSHKRSYPPPPDA